MKQLTNVLITIFISLFAILILSFGFTLLWFTIEKHNFAKELHQRELSEIEIRYCKHLYRIVPNGDK